MFVDDYIRSTDLWNQKLPPYQQSHNHFPKSSNCYLFISASIKLPHDVENDDSFDVGKINDLAIDLKLNIPPEVFGESASHHLLQRDLHVDGLVVQPRVELVRLVLTFGVERVAEVSVEPDTEVVVHDEDLKDRKLVPCSRCYKTFLEEEI